LDFQVQTPHIAMFRILRPFIPALAMFLLHTARAQDVAEPMDPDHVELRALKDQLVEGIEEGNMDLIDPLLHPDVVVTWQDGQVCKGPAAIRRFYADMAAKSKKTFQGYKVPPTADEPTILHAGNNAGVAYGYNVGVFHLAGKDFEMNNRWTATMVKQDGKWLLSSYHVSMNILDNPLLNTVKLVGIGGAAIALFAGVIIGRRIGRRRG
jgi:ketosteroid isomerase-like protein